MTKLTPTLAGAVLAAIDMSKNRQEVLIERPEGGRRRRMTVMALSRLIDVDRPSAQLTISWMKLIALSLLLAVGACTRPPPLPLERLTSPDQRHEITMWREEGGGTLDSNTYLTIAQPRASFITKNIFAQIKRRKDMEIYWSRDGKPVLSIREFYGFAASKNGVSTFIICGLPINVCRRLLPPSDSDALIRLGTYHTGESEPFPDSRRS